MPIILISKSREGNWRYDLPTAVYGSRGIYTANTGGMRPIVGQAKVVEKC